MGWAITADPQRFDEAISWLMQRSVITAEEAARLDHESRQRAFWVGGGLQLKQIQQVFDALNDAVAKGEPFKEFQKRMRRTLRDPVHAETVFRNAAQRAYNAGRYRQMREVERWRPFWKFDAILDSRTSTVCRARDGVTLHASSSWWRTNWPPLHHRCRSTVRSVRSGSVTTLPPSLPGTPGWGLTPDNDPVWKPDPNKHDPALLRELEQKQTKPPRPKKVKTKPEHDPAHWSKEYSHLGDAGPAAAYGRAMAERALDRTPEELRTEFKRLQDANHPSFASFFFRGLDQLPTGKPVRSSAWAQQNHALLALSEHTRSAGGAPMQLSGDSTPALDEAKRFYALTLGAKVKRPQGWKVVFAHGARAYAEGATKTVVLGDAFAGRTAIHELAHAIEFSDARALARSVALLKARTKGEKLKKLAELFPSGGYKDSERTREDKFLGAYWGKDYADLATEITSMGYETLARDPEELSRRDREMLYFLLGQLAGK